MSRTPVLSPSIALAALATLMTAALPAQAQSSPWLYRARAVNIDPADKGHTRPDLGLSLSRKTIPELDFSYFFTPNLAAELILTVPQRHTLYSKGSRIGSVKHLPPTLTLQYHFNPEGSFRPYVGAGLNYTFFSGARFEPAVQSLQPSIEKHSLGFAAQAGFDVALNKQWSLNVDVKKLQMNTDIRLAGSTIGKFKIDPLLIGVGLGYRF
jgi:outer membrane protein